LGCINDPAIGLRREEHAPRCPPRMLVAETAAQDLLLRANLLLVAATVARQGRPRMRPDGRGHLRTASPGHGVGIDLPIGKGVARRLLAPTNRTLARSNKSRTPAPATNKAGDSAAFQGVRPIGEARIAGSCAAASWIAR
jgi:hypothetical protein